MIKNLRADLTSSRHILNLKNAVHLQGTLRKKALEYLKS